MAGTVAHESSLGRRVRTYWDSHIHDLAITRHEVGSSGFFADLDQYHFEKLHHLQRLADFTGPPGRRVLDVGCGTGVDLVHFARGGASATGVDASQAAIRLASKNLGHQHLHAHLLVADGEDLPFRDRAFDCVSIGFGLRNVTHKERALAEMARVLAPGGIAVVLEFSHVSGPLAPLYDWYSFNVLPMLGRIVANDAASYRYLAESIRVHPDQDELKSLMERSGFDRVDYYNLVAGAVALHAGRVY